MLLFKTIALMVVALLFWSVVLVSTQDVAHAVTTFTVDSTADTDLRACTGAADDCTLRGAINAANSTANSGGADIINFNIPGGGVKTISPGSQLPTITDPVTINGYSQPLASPNTQAVGTDANLLIELDGSGAGGGSNGLVITGDDSTVGGLVINRFGASGIEVSGGATGTTIAGNYIGTDVSGAQGLSNTRGGVVIVDAPNNMVGGTQAGARNVISGNGANGIIITQFSGGDASGNEVMGNYIGADAGGDDDLGNTADGVFIQEAPGNTVGGAQAASRNVISGNGANGVAIAGGAASGNEVSGNYIGTDAGGEEDLGNGSDGVVIRDTPGNVVGGTQEGARNVVSGNGSSGVYVVGENSTDNEVSGNYLGTDKDGNQDLGNSLRGVLFDNAPNNALGGPTEAERNVISGNGKAGVLVTGTGATGNAILTNSIHDNGELGIDLNNDGVSANDEDDPDSGPNNRQNFPIIEEATKNPNGSTTVSGTLDSTPNETFTIEVFRNSEGVGPDPSGNGEGQTFVGRTSLTTNSSGDASFTITDPGGSTDDTYASTATKDATDDTSEFGPTQEANTAPSVTLDDADTANEGETKTFTFTITDPDSDDTQTVTFECGDNGEEVGTVTYDQTTGQGSFQCSFPDGPATTTVSVTTDDGTDTASDEITVDISNVAPRVELTGDSSANEGDTKTYTYTVTDPGNDESETFIDERCGDNGEHTDPESNSFQCRFPDGPAKTVVSVSANDGTDTASDEITVDIDNVGPAVELTGASSAKEGQTKTYTFTVTDPGEDAQTVTTTCGNNATKVSGSDTYDQTAGEGSLECRFPDGPATTTVSVSIDDGTDTASDQIEVQISNRAPTANPDSASTDESRPVKIRVLANDTDPGGKSDIDPSTVAVIKEPANGESRINSDGSITYTPRRGFTGQDSFTYRVCDEDGACSDPAKVTVTVGAAGCTITARSGQTTRGTNVDDVICGTSGNDVIYARGGNDIIRGGEGEDKLYGEDGSDTIRGEGGTDLLIGGTGPDVLEGGVGEDIMQGEEGEDTLEGKDGAPNDALNGGPGTDSCRSDRGDTVQSCP